MKKDRKEIMKYIKTYENLDIDSNEFELDDDRIGREVYVMMTEDEKYYFNYNSSHDGSLTNFRLVDISRMDVTFLENQARDEPYPDEVMSYRKHKPTDRTPNYKWFLPSGEEYPTDKLKNVKWFIGAFKV